MGLVSACLIVRDEIENIEAVVKSVRPHVDEVVIVDTGSVDGTRERAEQVADVFGTFVWCDDFSAARNFAMSLASSEWVLIIDADERLVVEDGVSLRLSIVDSKLPGIDIDVKNQDDSGEVVFRSPRIVRRDRGEYRGRIHEMPFYAGRPVGGLSFLTGVSLLHYGYLETVMVAKNKAERNLRIAKSVFEESGSSGSELELARASAMVGDYRAAAKHGVASYFSLRVDDPNRVVARSVAVRALTELKDWEGIVALCEPDGGRGKGDEAVFARAYAMLGRSVEARRVAGDVIFVSDSVSDLLVAAMVLAREGDVDAVVDVLTRVGVGVSLSALAYQDLDCVGRFLCEVFGGVSYVETLAEKYVVSPFVLAQTDRLLVEGYIGRGGVGWEFPDPVAFMVSVEMGRVDETVLLSVVDALVSSPEQVVTLVWMWVQATGVPVSMDVFLVGVRAALRCGLVGVAQSLAMRVSGVVGFVDQVMVDRVRCLDA
jgi:Glycosyl transferase family 2